MTIDASNDFDARRVGWRERRAAVRRISRAGWITAADRELRIRQAKTAQSRGELSVLMRGLDAGPSVPVYASYNTAYVPSPDTLRPVQATQPRPQQPPARTLLERLRPFRGRALGTIVAGIVLLSGVVTSCFNAVVDSASDVASSSSDPVPAIQTVGGWSDMVRAFEAETETGRIVELIVSPTAGSISIVDPDDSGSMLGFYFDGDVTSTTVGALPPRAQSFALDDIEPEIAAEAVARARSRSGAADTSQAWIVVTNRGSGPQLAVSFPDDTVGAYRLVLDAYGDLISETPR